MIIFQIQVTLMLIFLLKSIDVYQEFLLFNEGLILKWISEAWGNNSQYKFFLGTKIDLREDKETLQILADGGQAPIKREQGQKLANKIRAIKYLECSALTQRGLKQVNL